VGASLLVKELHRRIIDQYVDSAVSRYRRRHHSFDVSRLGDINVRKQGLATRLANSSRGCLALICLDISNDHTRAFPGVAPGDGLTDPGASSGDDCYFIL
jgi:hypothetical protein